MSNSIKSEHKLKIKVQENYREIEAQKRTEMLNLIAEIITKAILKELHEKSN